MAPAVLCFGELLWDFLPHGAFAGGAPANVAYHLHRLGVPVLPVSAVGTDDLGEKLLAHLRAQHLPTTAIARRPSAPTGSVTATLGPSGDARYTIATAVAWDRIPAEGVPLAAASVAPALVFGSLALRSTENRRALARLASALPPDAWRVFDVNLRAPHDDLALVRRYAPLANLLKLNSAEAARLAAGTGEVPGTEESHARHLAAEFGAPLVCITAGARGAGLLRGGHWTWVPARPVNVTDTVGAGDAFLAALLAGLIARRRTDGELVAHACRLGEWVASRTGATPDYDATTPAVI